MFNKAMKARQMPLSLVPSRPDLNNHVYNDEGLQSALLRSLAAIVTSDGTVNIAEYEALNELASQSVQPALAAHIVHTFLENPIEWKTSFEKLSIAVPDNEDVRKSAFEAALPVLKLQGNQSKELALELAKSLKIKLPSYVLDELENGSPTSVGNIFKRSSRLILDGKFLSLTNDCLRLTGDTEVARMVAGYLDGQIGKSTLVTRVTYLNIEIARKLGEFEQQIRDASLVELTAQKYVNTANELYEQVKQRLALVEARIKNDKSNFNDNFEEIIHDAGNAFELEVSDRLGTDKWKSTDVWESIAKSTFAKELERRVNNHVQHQEKQLQLMKEDLRLFQQEMRIFNASILERQHHTQFAKLMPSLRILTRTINAADEVANFTIKGGAVLTLATGTAAYYLGAAVVLPVIAPAAPYIGGAMLVAALFKWLTDNDSRKTKEIRHKREEFEKILRERLNEARNSYFEQLDTLGEDFIKSADALLKPILLEADAAHRLVGLQKRVAQKMLKDATKMLANLTKLTSDFSSQ